MRQSLSLTIPQPCHQSWAAMTPAAAGRHCSACATTVVDFTLKTDAEILAFLAGAARGRTCGRFAAGQLARPLQRAVPVAPTGRWRAWVAAAVAVWGLREGGGEVAKAQVSTEQHNRPAASEPKTSPVVAVTPFELVLRGVVRDSATHDGLPGVTVLIKGTVIGISTAADGSYELAVPAAQWQAGHRTIRFSSIGFVTQEVPLTSDSSVPVTIDIILHPDHQAFGEVVMMGGLHYRRPWPWHPRALFNWSRYWLTRTFQRS